MTEAVAWSGLPRQRICHACHADEILFGGVKGGSKTDALIMKPAETLALADRKYRETGRKQRCMMVIFRKTLQNESRDMIKRTQDLYPLMDPAATWKEQAKRWEFESGASVSFGHLDGPNDYKSWNGLELVGFGADQAEECLSYEVYKFFTGQVRHSDPDYDAAKWILLTGNPGGKHADWLYEYFIGEPQPPDEKIQTWDTPVKDGTMMIRRTKAFIISRLKDNPYYYNSGGYEAVLRSMTPEQQRWYINGDWSASVAGYFSAVSKPAAYIASATVPRSWDITYAIQYDASETAIVVAARSPKGRIYVIDEIVMPSATGLDAGRALVARFATGWDSALRSHERKRKHDEMIGFINPEAAPGTGARAFGLNVSTEMNSLGLRILAGETDRVAGWRQLRQRLATPTPMIQVFEEKCPLLVRQLKRAQASAKDPSDIDDGVGENVTHKSLNALRMICQAWPMFTPYVATDPETSIDAWINRMSPRAAERNDTTTGYGD